MKKSAFVILLLLFAGVTNAESTSENITNISNTNSIKLNTLMHTDGGFSIFSPTWSADGKYLLFGSFKPISMAQSVNKHYLLDIENRTYGEIDYGITEKESNYISPSLGWVPCNHKIYFSVSKNGGPGEYGGNIVICNPDSTDMRALDSPNTTTLSDIISRLGKGITYYDLSFSPNCSKVSFSYEDPKNPFGNIWIENLDGTGALELQANAYRLVWSNSTTVMFQTIEGNIIITDCNGKNIRSLTSPNKGEEYLLLSMSPDRKKITTCSKSDDDEYQFYVSNIDGSGLLNINSSYLEFFGSGPVQLEFGIWQPNGSTMLLNENGNLYVLEGSDNKRRLLYDGNATQPQWFPDGNKVLFIENENQIYSIDLDGTNLLHITNIGLTTHYIWDTYDINEVSISPSGKTIAFTSALGEDGKFIGHEPSIESRKFIRAPLFTINSDGTNLTQITPAVKGRHDFIGQWSPDSKMLTASTIQFVNDETIFGNFYLVSLDNKNLADGWKEMPVSSITEKDTLVRLNKSSQASVKNIEDKEGSTEQNSHQSPSFRCTDLFVSLICVYLLKWRK